MNPHDLRTLIKNTLTPFNMYSAIAEELLMATCANESNLGQYRTQSGNGPARGIFQVEGNTFNDLFTNYLAYHPALKEQVCALFQSNPPNVDELVTNDPAAIVIARLQYWRSPHPLPATTAPTDLWSVYKPVYNTAGGAATELQFLQKYAQYVAPSLP